MRAHDRMRVVCQRTQDLNRRLSILRQVEGDTKGIFIATS
jgi:hypothetical protein